MRTDDDTFASRCGRFYEIAAKTGLVRALIEWLPIFQCPTASRSVAGYLDTLVNDLNQYQFDYLVRRVIDDPEASPEISEAVAYFLDLLAMQGSLTAYGATREYLRYLNSLDGRNQRLGLIDIPYLQAPVLGDFGVGDRDAVLADTVRRVNGILTRPVMIDLWSRVGEFLRADVLLLAATERGLNLFVADMSCAAPRSAEQVLRLNTPDGLVGLLERDIHHLEAKAVFSPANFESSDLTFELSEKVGDYFQAFGSSDKEPSKIIQAMSYAASFLTALEQHGSPMLPADWKDTIQINVMAVTNRAVETCNLDIKNRDLLRAARRAYRRSKGVTGDE